jgi:hypothetical protein
MKPSDIMTRYIPGKTPIPSVPFIFIRPYDVFYIIFADYDPNAKPAKLGTVINKEIKTVFIDEELSTSIINEVVTVKFLDGTTGAYCTNCIHTISDYFAAINK